MLDGYVRIPTAALAGVELRHLVSQKDVSIVVPGGGATITGLSEWVGSWQSEVVSIGWDWAVVDGVIAVINPNEIRTNIQLVSRDGSAEPTAIVQIHLLHWIESFNWRDGAVHDLLVSENCTIGTR